MTTMKAICETIRARLALVPTTRDATVLFIEHKTSQPFERSPASKTEAFNVVPADKSLKSGFGVTGSKEERWTFEVQLGHGPFGRDYEREDNRSRDCDRIADILEGYGSYPTGTEAVWFDGVGTPNKIDPNWWVSTLRFTVHFNSSIETS